MTLKQLRPNRSDAFRVILACWPFCSSPCTQLLIKLEEQLLLLGCQPGFPPCCRKVVCVCVIDLRIRSSASAPATFTPITNPSTQFKTEKSNLKPVCHCICSGTVHGPANTGSSIRHILSPINNIRTRAKLKTMRHFFFSNDSLCKFQAVLNYT